MIVRAIVQNPDKMLAVFDYFNDYNDTKRWLVRNGYVDIAKRLDDGEKKNKGLKSNMEEI